MAQTPRYNIIQSNVPIPASKTGKFFEGRPVDPNSPRGLVERLEVGETVMLAIPNANKEGYQLINRIVHAVRSLYLDRVFATRKIDRFTVGVWRLADDPDRAAKTKARKTAANSNAGGR